ncbi:MAG TPA: hypothetical protein DF613_05015, partial [Lachnospiraceae bacterium]|nr:hypothetical protein [Lachnospiraceae bacterium]
MSGEIRKILVVVIWLVLIFGMISPAPVRAAEKKSSQTASAKGKWQTKKGRKYFKKADGHYAKGSCRIDGKYYVFSRKGKLMCPEKASLKTVMEETYYVSSSGRAIGGWNIIGDNLYYSEKTGLIKKNTVREGITLSKTGAAKKNRAYKMKVKVMKTVASVTKSKKTKEKKLRACWKYISGKEFRYRLKYPDL